MQTQKILRAIDAMNTQDRVILHLACGHNISVWRHVIAAMPPVQAVGLFELGATWDCEACPNLPPPSPEELRLAKSANQLWKEAGEP